MNTNATEILSLLEKQYPDAKIILNYSNPWELLVAVILSAQCTDKRVNIVTKMLFEKYKTIDDYVHADLNEFSNDIRSTGFYNAKAKHILGCARIINKKFNNTVPNTMKEILTLPGVARKTANVVLSNAYGVVEGIAVDTHVKRLSLRLALSKQTDPDKIELDLMKIITKKQWSKITYMLIEHGRTTCQAKKPRCSVCFLNNMCPSAFSFPKYE
jgi:endonuclease III